MGADPLGELARAALNFVAHADEKTRALFREGARLVIELRFNSDPLKAAAKEGARLYTLEDYGTVSVRVEVPNG